MSAAPSTVALRDYFAALAMQAFIARIPDSGSDDPYFGFFGDVASDAYAMADEMLTERGRA